MTNYEKILECLRQMPTMTNSEIVEATGLEMNTVKVYLTRLKDKGLIEVERDGNLRTVTVLKQLPISKNEYKKNIVENMIDRYMEDFENCEILTDRIEVGKIILKLLERL